MRTHAHTPAHTKDPKKPLKSGQAPRKSTCTCGKRGVGGVMGGRSQVRSSHHHLPFKPRNLKPRSYEYRYDNRLLVAALLYNRS